MTKENLVNQQQNIYIITKSIANEQKKEWPREIVPGE